MAKELTKERLAEAIIKTKKVNVTKSRINSAH